MTDLVIFWSLTAACTVCALAFIIPPIWLVRTTKDICLRRQQILSLSIIISLPLLAYSIYAALGASDSLAKYYSASAREQRANNQQMRPYYARIQRELIKSRMDLAMDPKNIDLIINFAGIHSKLAGGVLQPDIKELLESVLKAVPGQVTVLNLLAVNAYKTEDYDQAIAYWQRILAQITPQMRDSEAENILKTKIAQTKSKLKSFESRQTK